MDLSESNIEFRIRPGSVYRENRLVPVTGTVKGKFAFLNSIKRETIKSEDLICCLKSVDGSQGVFVDTSGREYVITQEELESKLTFFNSKYRKTIIPRYTFRRGSKEEFLYLMDKFLVSSETKKRYKGWVSERGVVGEENISESFSLYRVGGTYISDDGKFEFKIVKKVKGGYRIKDIKDNVEYEVELSDLSLLNPREV